MIGELVLALGLVAVLEGLVLALAPNRFEQAVRALTELEPETRRLIGLAVIALGVFIVWLARTWLS